MGRYYGGKGPKENQFTMVLTKEAIMAVITLQIPLEEEEVTIDFEELELKRA